MQRRIIISNYDDLKNPNYGGGGAVAIHELAKRLSKEHKVTVYTGSYPNSVDEIIDNVSYKRIGTSVLGPKFGQLIYSLILPVIAMKGNFDIWLESFTPPFSTGFLPMFTHKPVIGICHMLASADMRRKYKLPFFSLIENIGLKVYKNIISSSPYFTEKIRRQNKKANVYTIPNGVEIPKNTFFDGKYILYLGRIEVNQKGLDHLIDAYQKVYANTKVKLIIAGTGDKKEVKKLKTLIRKANLVRCAVMVGKVSGKEKDKILKQAMAVVLPSRFDTYPLVVLEAASYQKPLITFDIESLGWIPNTYAIKAQPFKTDDLAVKIEYLIKARDHRYALALEGKKLAETHTWEKYAENYTTVINKATAE